MSAMAPEPTEGGGYEIVGTLQFSRVTPLNLVQVSFACTHI